MRSSQQISRTSSSKLDSDMTSAEVPIYIKHIKSIRWNHISPMYLSVMFEMMLGKAPLFCINMLFLESPFRENKTEKFKRESVYAVAVTSALKVTFKAFNVDLALCPQDIFNWFAIMDDADFMDHLIKLLQNLEDDSRFALHQAVSYAARHGSSSVLKLFLKKTFAPSLLLRMRWRLDRSMSRQCC
ncbi:hypothetical protein BC829DRAFT_96437 [Chytridium lagenaria]|nr:hypothetical protein BC829DRAFT_96437 [Chytridium lagenaria]